MRFTVNQSVVAPAVAAAARIAPPKPVFPALEGVLLKTCKDVAIVRTTNFEMSLELVIKPVQIEEEGEVLVSAKLLNSLLHKLGGELAFQTSGSLLEIKSAASEVKAVTYDPEGIPNLDCAGGNSLTFKSREWRSIFRKALLSTFDGIFFDLKEDAITVMGTDKYRISLLDIFYPGCGEGNFFVSREQIEKLLPLLSEGDEGVSINWDDKLLTFQSQQFVFTCRRTVARMPDYAKIMPQNKVAVLELERASAVKAFERASLFSVGSDPPPVRIERNGAGTLVVFIENADMGSLKEALPCEGTGEFAANYKPSFLFEALKTADAEKITFELYEQTFLKIKSGDYTVLVAPVIRQ